jgi:hypothetical protein
MKKFGKTFVILLTVVTKKLKRISFPFLFPQAVVSQNNGFLYIIYSVLILTFHLCIFSSSRIYFGLLIGNDDRRNI